MQKIKLKYGNVKNKKIETKNDFVSHMVEHIAWRMGLEISLKWEDENWKLLGKELGKAIKNVFSKKDSESSSEGLGKRSLATTIGMIDDGVIKIKIEKQSEKIGVNIQGSKNVNLEIFLKSRCEQLERGEPLINLLEGVSEGLDVNMEVCILNSLDPHHTWEAIFRGIGICLGKMFAPKMEKLDLYKIDILEKDCSFGDINVLERSLTKAKVSRGTAESGVTVEVDFGKDFSESEFCFNVGESIKREVENLDKLLLIFAKSFGVCLKVDFNQKFLSSSHVVLEDIGLVLGRTLFEILVLRFDRVGVNGAGSSIQDIKDYSLQNGIVGVSVEGRKLWKFIPLDGDYKNLNDNFLQYQNVFENIRSEDLDDFFDGLSGGLNASVMVQIGEIDDVNLLWQRVFSNLGKALKEVFEVNISRKGLPPGVKATLS